MKRTIIFRCHSPFTIFTASIIGEIYYKDEIRVLLTSYGKNIGLHDRVVRSGLFDEVYSFKEDSAFIEDVEKEVCEFFEKYPKIDEVFTYLFSDRYSTFLAYKLADKTKLCIIPEGSSVINFKERMEMLYQEAYGKIGYLKSFYDKYPIDLSLFSELWIYDEKMIGEELPFKTREILFSQQKEDIRSALIEKLNILFGYQENDLDLYDAIYLDDNLSERGWMFADYEKQMLEYLFHQISDKRILVKPHPGQDVHYEEQKFSYSNAKIFNRSDIPWELLYINAMNKKKQKSIVIISMWMSTAIYSSLKLTGRDNKVIILSFVKMGTLYYNDLLKKSNRLSSAYYEKIEQFFDNIRLILPENEEEVSNAIEECFAFKTDTQICLESVKNKHAINYFKRVGNLFENSILKDENNIYKSCYNYLDDCCEVIFKTSSFIEFKNISWIPSLRDIYSSVKQIKVIAVDDSACEYIVYEMSDLPILLTDTEVINITTEYKLYCEKVKVVFRGDIRQNISQLVSQNFDLKWRKDFWERWLDIVQQQRVKETIKEKNLKNVAIYGCGKIGEKIYREFAKYGVILTIYEVKRRMKDEIEVCELDRLSEKTQFPDIFVVTPMNEFHQICHSVPRTMQDKVVSLEEFLSFLEK